MLIGHDVMVPLADGGHARYANFDYAANAPCLESVKITVDELLGWYASVHRGTGWKSQVTTAAYEAARTDVAEFVGARDNDCVIFTRNTTDGINLLAHVLPAGGRVVTWASEHHADLLPWQRHHLHLLEIPPDPMAALTSLHQVLRYYQVDLVAVTGASNVTGEVWPIAEIAGLAHRYGAKVVLDAAQLAPHQPVDIRAWEVDVVALSGHKLYAPFGAGALVGHCDWLEQGPPMLRGGGAVDFVHVDDVAWTHLPDRQEAGSPNVVGAVTLATACRELIALGMAQQEWREEYLVFRLEKGLQAIDGLRFYRMWPDGHLKVPVLTFNLEHVPYAVLATALSAEYGIGVRHGCFCAHPLMIHLLGIPDNHARELAASRHSETPQYLPGAVRASLGLGTTEQDVDLLIMAVTELAAREDWSRYQLSTDGTECSVIDDQRRLPCLPFPL